ncbi:hypothetical protein [Bradyrhizobium elkanii]|uniref:hypothetical protein n=1 Tax=Bradyrhizobium elkanii TaxID=29448 RepID=UPI0012FE5F77|nr:hypothetical protein [Bradyrhizobium elkanii]
MSRRCSRTTAFNTYGLKLKNVRHSLSALCEQRRKVAISLWQDEFSGNQGHMIYERPSWGDWYDGPGRREFFHHLSWARDNRNGIVDIVICIRRRAEGGHVLTDSFARPGLVMQIRHLDPSTGAFRLEQVVPDKQAA